MKILVCIKQVPDPESRLEISGTWIKEEDLAFRMNEYDEFAVEQAVQLKDQESGELVVLSVGPDRAVESLKKALAMGADRAIHIADASAPTKDPFQIASLIHGAVKDEGFEAIFTGQQSQDRGSGQVGVLLAEMLGIEAVTTLVGFSFAGGIASVKRELEGGTKALVEVPLPALFTCQLGLNTPRYPTLPNIMKAKKKEIKKIDPSDVAAKVTVKELFVPAKKGGAEFIEGDIASMADRLIARLKEKTSVLS